MRTRESAPAAVATQTLIVADGLCPRIAELVPGALHELVALGATPDPLRAVGAELVRRRLQGQPVDTLHLVAHGRRGAVQVGGQWIDAASLIGHADQLALWQVGTIALWSCEVGADRGFVALLEELAGAHVWASHERLGASTAGNGRSWQLHNHLRGEQVEASTQPTAPFAPAALQAWPHHLDATMDSQLSLFNLSSSSDTTVELLNALAEAERLIAELLQGDEALTVLFQLFNGGASEPSAEWLAQAEQFISSFQSDALSLNVELRASADLLGAYGAYAATGPAGEPVIYLNEARVAQFSPAELTRLILEEAGHWIDNQLNGSTDTPGDEGEAFAATVLGTDLSEAEWDRIHSENDIIRLTIDGVEVEVEMASLLFSSRPAYFVQSSSSVTTTQLETSSVYTKALVGETGDRYVFISDPEEPTLFSGNNVKGTLYVVDSNYQVRTSYFGEISRLYKSGSNIIGLQFYVYPDGYTPGSGDRTTTTTQTILIDLGANFQLNTSYSTSSDPVDAALNALLPSNTPPTAVNDTDTAYMRSCSSGQPLADASGNVLTGVGSNGDASGADSDLPVDYVYEPSGGLFGEGSISTIGDTLVVKSIASDPTKDSSIVAAGSTSISANATSVQGTYGSLTIGADGSYVYDVDETNSALIALAQGQTTTDIFTYQVADSTGLISSATLTITIVGGNDGPTAVNDYEYLEEGLTIPAALATTDASGAKLVDADKLLLNDSDPDTGDSFRITQAAKADDINDEDLSGASIVTANGIELLQKTVGFTYTVVRPDTGTWQTQPIVGQKVWIAKGTSTQFYETDVTVTAVGGAPDGRPATFSAGLNVEAGDRLWFTATNIVIPPTYSTGNTVASVDIPSTTRFVFTDANSDPSPGSTVSGPGIAPNTTISEVATLNFGANYILTTFNQSADIAAAGTTADNILNPGEELQIVTGAIFGAYGYLNLKDDGSYTYIQTVDISNNIVVDEYFSYQIIDASGCTDTAVLHLQIEGAPPSPPTAGADTFDVIEEGIDASGNNPGTSPVSGNVLTNDTDASGGSVSGRISSVWTAATSDTPLDVSGNQVIDGQYGTLTIDASGVISYDLDDTDVDVQALRQLSDTLTDEFYYEILETDGDIGVGTLSIQIKGTNDTPDAVNDSETAVEAGGVANSIPGFNPTGNVFLNDTDVDAGDTKTVQSFQGSDISGNTVIGTVGTGLVGKYGTLSLDASGNYTYTVNNNLAVVQALDASGSLTETFNYTLVDAAGATDSAVLTINIQGANDQLTVSDVAVNEGSPWAVFVVNGLAGERITLDLDIDGSGNGFATEREDFGDPSGVGSGLQIWDGDSWENYDPSATQLDSSGNLYVRASILNDTTFEDAESFLLKATTSDNNTSAGKGVIYDDGTGSYFSEVTPPVDGSGNLITDPSGILDDDRSIAVTGGAYNEASDYIFWTVTGAAGQNIKFVGLNGDPSGADPNADLSGNLQYRDASGIWQTFDASSNAVIDASGNPLLIRKAVVNDTNPEGLETFQLIVENTAGTDASGNSSLNDNGTGLIPFLDASGNPTDASGNPANTPVNDPSQVKDDDRTLSVTGAAYNEASDYIFWTVTGAAGQNVKFVGLNGDPSGADPNADLSGNLQYRDASGIWQTFDASSNAVIDASGNPLLIRKAVVNDTNPEGLETFQLIVENTAGTDASGNSSLNDNGTGLIPFLDASGNPTDASGNPANTPVNDPSQVKDDDRTLSVTGAAYNEASDYIFWTVTGAAGQVVQFVGLNGDPSGADPNADLSGNLQYRDASGIWQTFDASSNAVIDASGNPLLIRKAVVNDTNPEGLETFQLIVENTAGTDASGNSSLNDNGTGLIPFLDASGNPTDASGNPANTPVNDPSQVKDDDRTLSVTGAAYNEASDYIFWTVTGAAGQVVQFVGLNGDPSGADPNADLSGNLQYRDASGIWQTFDASSNAVIDASGNPLLIRKAVVNDTNPEGLETFQLIVENTAGTDASGNSSLNDNGTGLIPFLDASGNPTDASGNPANTPVNDPSQVKDDDRTLSVTGAAYNEASDYIFWTVTGAAGQNVKFVGLNGDPSGADPNADLSGNLQYRDASGIWQTFDASSNAVIDASGNPLLIRKAVVNDTNPEGLETFQLIVENTAGTDASGNSSLNDNGTGLIPFLDASGNPTDASGNPANTPVNDPSQVKDDDRTLSVTGAAYNEASDYIFWTVTGAAGQNVQFVGLNGDPSGADPNADLSGNLQYRDASGIWQTFDASSNAVIDASGNPLLIRKAVVNDTNPEGLETFQLIVENTAGTDASGNSSLNDNGTGLIPFLDASGNPTDASGNPANTPVNDPSQVKDDDRTLSVTGAAYNEASDYIFWTVTGAAGQNVKFVGLNGDPSGADPNADLSGNLQYRDASGIWQTFDASSNAVIDASGNPLLIRKAVVNDTNPEGLETFQLIVENTAGTDASGNSSLNDNGTGLIPFLDASGNPTDASGNPANTPVNDPSQVKDDDRTLSVTGAAYNEASDYIFWTVTGAAGQNVKFVGLNGDPSGADPNADLSGNLQYRDASGIWQTFDASSNAVIDASGNPLLIRKAVVNDTNPEGLETFQLIVENTAGTDASGNSSLNDNGTGLIPFLDASGNPTDASGNPANTPVNDPSQVKDDDRTLSVTGAAYNEASDYIFWTVTGAAGQVVQFVGLNGDPSGADPNADLSGNLQYRDASGIWQTFDASSNAVIDASGNPLLIRKAVVNDTNPEGLETFQLIVQNTGGTDASGNSSLNDNGTGLIPFLDASGNPTDASGNPANTPVNDPSQVKDDDRTLSVTGAAYNEASDYIFWTVTGAAGQVVQFVGLNGDPSGADPNADLSGNLQYRDASGIWQTFDASSNAVIDASGNPLLIRKAVVNDTNPEGLETFQLIVQNTGGTDASGNSSLNDNGTGLIPVVDPSGNPTLDPSGIPTDASGVIKDDDRLLSVTGAAYNEAAPYIFWTVTGAAGQVVQFVGLNGDPSGADPNADLSGNLQYRDAAGIWQTFDASSNALLDASGSLLIRKAVVNDTDPEGLETFQLIVQNTGGTDASGNSSLNDNGTGLIPVVDPSGNPTLDPSGIPTDASGVIKDDDRLLSVTGAAYNEAAPYIFWTVTGTAGQVVQFVGLNGDPSGADPNADLSGNLQYRDASGIWQTFDASSNALLDASGSLLIRKAVVNDTDPEGLETFQLIVQNTGGTDASGNSSLNDNGTGLIPVVDPSGNPTLDPSGIPTDASGVIKDDDRLLSVTGAAYNEAAPYIFWTVTGTAGQVVQFVGLNGDPSGADPNADLSGNLQYRDASGIWQTFDASSNALLDASGSLLIRKAVVNDTDPEGLETFQLIVQNTGGTDASGNSSLNDNGTGLIPVVDPSGNPTLDPSGIPTDASGVIKDDDREDDDGIPGDVEVGLATNVANTTGEGTPGDLNGDGIQDNQQPAFAVLAWITVDKFQAGLDGTLPSDEIEPIISLTAAAGTSGTAVDQALQLINIEVLPPDSSLVGGSKPSGDGIEAPWDPITFAIQPLAAGGSLTDSDNNPANGTQVRVVIDISRAGVREGDFNGYLKYISQATIDAAAAAEQPLVDLDGKAITTPGWIDFLQRTDASGNPVGNGARFITEDGFITAFELVFTDNQFGDNSLLQNVIQDPNLPVKLLPAQLVPTADGKGLEVLGYPGQTLWADFSAVLADATLQNGLDLVRVAPNGDQTRIGTIGASPDSGFLGDTRVQLTVGDVVRFSQVSGNLPANNTPDLAVSGGDDCLIIRLDDTSPSDGDANDLVLKVKTSTDDPYPETTRMARYQLGSELAYLDLSWIPANGVTLQLDVKTDCGQNNTIGLVRVDTDPNTGEPLGTVAGLTPGTGNAFDDAVRDNLLSFSYSQSGSQTVSGLDVTLQGSQAGVYAPVLITPNGTIYTFGSTSSSDQSQHVKVLGANSFGFEDLPNGLADWDFNDTVISFQIADPTPPRLELTADGRGLTVVAGSSGASGLWLDLNAVLADSDWQNSFDLIKRLANGQEVAVGSVGATSQGTFLGGKELFLAVGESLHFVQNSNDNPSNLNPLLAITKIGERYRIGLDDNGDNGGATSDGDFNDLILDVDSSPLNPCEEVVKLASQQLTSSDGILDLTGIGADGLSLSLSVSTDSSDINTLSFVKLDVDPVTGKPLDQVAGVAASADAAFREAIRANLVDFSTSAGGQSSQSDLWQLSAADSGYYAAVLVTPDGELFTFGDTTGADGGQHLKVLGDSSFGFEDRLGSQGSDWDYNDFIVKVTPV